MLTLVVAGLAAGGAYAIFGVSIVVLHRMAEIGRAACRERV